MSAPEYRTILPRRVSPLAMMAAIAPVMAAPAAAAAPPPYAPDLASAARHVDAIIVGRDNIMDAAMQAAMNCLPAGIQQKLQACAPPGSPNGCAQLQKTYISQSAAAASTGATLTWNTFQKPFKLAKLSISSADADKVLISSINVAGVNLLVNGSMSGGVASTANEDGGVAIDGDWVYPGNTITLVFTSAALGAITYFTLGGLTTP